MALPLSGASCDTCPSPSFAIVTTDTVGTSVKFVGCDTNGKRSTANNKSNNNSSSNNNGGGSNYRCDYRYDPITGGGGNHHAQIQAKPESNFGPQTGRCGSVAASTASSNGASRHRRRAANMDDENGTGLLVALQQKLFEHYHLIAYTIVISMYFIAFCEYIYLRLIAIVFPDHIVYYKQCRKHANETILRNEVHFASTILVFVFIGVFQLTCFFLLTVSEKWLDVRRTFSHFVSLEERLRHELAFAIRRVMFTTVFAAFVVYCMCSAVVICAIFYVVGIRDAVGVGSQVLIYFFDGCVIMYFCAFPVVCVLFHPDIRHGKKHRRKLQASPPVNHADVTAPGSLGDKTGYEDSMMRQRRFTAPQLPRTAAIQQQRQRQISSNDLQPSGKSARREAQDKQPSRIKQSVKRGSENTNCDGNPRRVQKQSNSDPPRPEEGQSTIGQPAKNAVSTPPLKPDRLSRIVDRINTLPGRAAAVASGASDGRSSSISATSSGMQVLQNKLRADRYRRLSEPDGGEDDATIAAVVGILTNPTPSAPVLPVATPAVINERRTKL